MRYVAVAVVATLLGGPWAPRPAGADELEMLEDGYTAVRIGTEWTSPSENVFPKGPQTDRRGNAYRVAGGAPGTVILKASPDRVSRFARVSGEGSPVVLGLWFDENNHMVVVIQREVEAPSAGGPTDHPLPALAAWGIAGLERERVYYRIKGFAGPDPAAAPPAKAGKAGAQPMAPFRAQTSAAGSAGAILAFVCLAMTALVRQVHRDATDLWRRR